MTVTINVNVIRGRVVTGEVKRGTGVIGGDGGQWGALGAVARGGSMMNTWNRRVNWA